MFSVSAPAAPARPRRNVTQQTLLDETEAYAATARLTLPKDWLTEVYALRTCASGVAAPHVPLLVSHIDKRLKPKDAGTRYLFATLLEERAVLLRQQRLLVDSAHATVYETVAGECIHRAIKNLLRGFAQDPTNLAALTYFKSNPAAALESRRKIATQVVDASLPAPPINLSVPSLALPLPTVMQTPTPGTCKAAAWAPPAALPALGQRQIATHMAQPPASVPSLQTRCTSLAAKRLRVAPQKTAGTASLPPLAPNFSRATPAYAGSPLQAKPSAAAEMTAPKAMVCSLPPQPMAVAAALPNLAPSGAKFAVPTVSACPSVDPPATALGGIFSDVPLQQLDDLLSDTTLDGLLFPPSSPLENTVQAGC